MEISPKTTKKGKIKDFLGKGEIYYNPETNTLTLNNATILEGVVTFSEPGTIELIGENNIMGLKNTHYAFINPNGNPITIKGEGELCMSQNVTVNRLLVKDCTLHIKHCFFLSGIGHMRVERANVIIASPVSLLNIEKDIDLQGCSIVYNSRIDSPLSIDYDNPDVVIIQKDRQKTSL